MTDISDEGADDSDRFAAAGTALKDAWVQTVEDMRSMADERRDQGWDAVAVPAGDTTAVSADAGDDDRFGFVHVVADNHAEAFLEAFEGGEFPRFRAYRNTVEGFVYLLTELLDPETETAVLVAGQYELRNAAAMVRSAREEGALYTHVRTIDGTHLGSVRHEELEPLVPNPDSVKQWEARHGVARDE